jgi:hypothetical protein
MDIAKQSIGNAFMQNDGTIVLDLRAEGEGVSGIGRLVYPPSHPQYQYVMNHLGGLRPGENKPVMPFDDDQPKVKKPPPETGSKQNTCSSCGLANPVGSRFCNQCGSQLGCPSCGWNNATGSKFCNGCGAQLLCLSCAAQLSTGRKFCVKCGEPVRNPGL